MSAASLIGSFSAESGGEIKIGRLRATVRQTYPSAQWRHLPSRAAYDPDPLPWPTIDYEVNGPDTTPRACPSGFMIGRRSPSFTDVESAIRAFFYGDFAAAGAGRTTSRIALIRNVDKRAWIDRVAVRPTRLTVSLRGSDVAGVEVELASGPLRVRQPSGSSGRVELALPSGLSDDAWLYVTRGNEWLDYRAFGPTLPGARALVERGIEIAIPDDPDGAFAALISQGEGPGVEFKRQLPDDTDGSRQNVFKTVAAFANGRGGTIAFGVDSDEVTVQGVAGNERQIRDVLGSLISRIVVPVPDFRTRWANASGKRVLLLEVEQGASSPYGIQLHPDGHVLYYFRRGASTLPASQQEVREIALRGAVAPSRPHWSSLIES